MNFLYKSISVFLKFSLLLCICCIFTHFVSFTKDHMWANLFNKLVLHSVYLKILIILLVLHNYQVKTRILQRTRRKLVQWSAADDQTLNNVWFQKHSIFLWTCKRSGSYAKNLMDDMTINRRYKFSSTIEDISKCRLTGGHLHLLKHNLKLGKLKISKSMFKLQFISFWNDLNYKQMSADIVKNKYNDLDQSSPTIFNQHPL